MYYTQVMQAETLASAYRLWRRNWKGRGKEYTAGALVWQVSVQTTPTACEKPPPAPEALVRGVHDYKPPYWHSSTFTHFLA